MFPWRSLRIRSSPFSSDGFFSIFRFYKEDKADQIDEYRAEREKDGEEKTAPRFYKAFRENPAEQMRAANFQQKDLRDDQRAQECGKRYPPALIQKRRLPGNFFIVDFVERQSDVRGTFRKLHLPRISPFFDDFPYVENPEHSVQTVEQQDIVIEIGNFLVQPTDDDFFSPRSDRIYCLTYFLISTDGSKRMLFPFGSFTFFSPRSLGGVSISPPSKICGEIPPRSAPRKRRGIPPILSTTLRSFFTPAPVDFFDRRNRRAR